MCLTMPLFNLLSSERWYLVVDEILINGLDFFTWNYSFTLTPARMFNSLLNMYLFQV